MEINFELVCYVACDKCSDDIRIILEDYDPHADFDCYTGDISEVLKHNDWIIDEDEYCYCADCQVDEVEDE